MSKGEQRSEAEALVFIEPLIPLLQRGMSEKQSCEYAGVPESTLNLYKKKFPKVWSRIRTAKMTLIAKASDTVANNIDDPKIALEVLKRRSRREWGDNYDITTNDDSVNSIKVEWAVPVESGGNTNTK